MKRFAAMAAGLAMVFAFAGQASAQTTGITGSAHDFNGDAWNTTGEICVVCHTPHNSQAQGAAPLWNHTVSTFNYTGFIYTGYDMDSPTSNPTGSSLLCLSCHDGSVALDAFGGSAGTVGNDMGTLYPARNLDTDLRDDHPVGMGYQLAIDNGDGELRDPATAPPGWSGVGAVNDVLDGGAGGTVECASCHDVHNSVSGTTFLLRSTNAGSQLCFGCHIK